ncbi:hypothetical protein VTL71DRAFT_9019 [Oculimacula yallundae]|uniref:2EXR domain-containing protein n=1 Tax=Oculimacula yallundae TaxID=86028 RepID=A0ABR4BTJ6_9HELO
MATRRKETAKTSGSSAAAPHSTPAIAPAPPLEPASLPSGRVTRSITKMSLPSTEMEKSSVSEKIKLGTPEEEERRSYYVRQLQGEWAELHKKAAEPSGPRTHRLAMRKKILPPLPRRLQPKTKVVDSYGRVTWVFDDSERWEWEYFEEPIPDDENPAIAEVKDPGGWIAHGKKMAAKHKAELNPSVADKKVVCQRFQKTNRDLSLGAIQQHLDGNRYQPHKYGEFSFEYVIKPEAKCPTLFRNFNKVPPKIRKWIWDIALLEEPRSVSITQHAGAYVNTTGPDVFAIEAWDEIPVLLRVNRESREVAMKIYKLVFKAVEGRPQFFNIRADVLHLWAVDPGFVKKIPSLIPEFHMVRHLAIHGAGLLKDNQVFKRLRYFPNLVTLLIESPSKRAGKIESDTFYRKFDHSIGKWLDGVREGLALNSLAREVQVARSKKFQEQRAKARAEERAKAMAEIYKAITDRSRNTIGKTVRFANDQLHTKTAIKDPIHRVAKISSTPLSTRDSKMVLKKSKSEDKLAVTKAAGDPMDVDTQSQQHLATVSSYPTALPKKLPKEGPALQFTTKPEIEVMQGQQADTVSSPAATLPKEHSTESQPFHPAMAQQVEVSPEINSLIDNAIAEMPDVDMMIDEEMADISSTKAPRVQVKQADAISFSTTNNHTGTTTLAAVSKEASPVEHANTTMIDGDVGDQVPAGVSESSRMEVDNQEGIATSATVESKKAVAVDTSSADINSKEGESNAQSAETAVANRAPKKENKVIEASIVQESKVLVYRVAKMRVLTVVWSKSEDILEVLVDARKFPYRVDMNTRYYTWKMPKARAAKYQTGFDGWPEDSEKQTTNPVENESAAPVEEPSAIVQPAAEDPGNQILAITPNVSVMQPPANRPQAVHAVSSIINDYLAVERTLLRTPAHNPEQALPVQASAIGPLGASSNAFHPISHGSPTSSVRRKPVPSGKSTAGGNTGNLPSSEASAVQSIDGQDYIVRRKAYPPGMLPPGAHPSVGNTSTGPTYGSLQSGELSPRGPNQTFDLNKPKKLPKTGTFYTTPQPQSKGTFFTQPQEKNKISISKAGVQHYTQAPNSGSSMIQQAPASYMTPACYMAPASYMGPAPHGFQGSFAPPPAPYVSPYQRAPVPMAPLPPQDQRYISPYSSLSPTGSVGGAGIAGSVAGLGTTSLMGTGATSITESASERNSGGNAGGNAGGQSAVLSGINAANSGNQLASPTPADSQFVLEGSPPDTSTPVRRTANEETASDTEGDTIIVDV